MTVAHLGADGVRRARVLGVPVDCVTMDEALAIFEEFIRSGTPHLVATADSSGIAQAQRDPELRKIYEDADLVTPDSLGVVWALRRAGERVSGRVSGVDVLDRVCALSAEKGYRIYLLGGEPGVANEAAENLRRLHPGCNIVGSRHGFFSPEERDSVAGEVAATKPDFLFVGLGIPRQEQFISQTETVIRAGVGIGVGGSLDVFSGRAKRAPAAFQRLGLEWLWRVMMKPSKISKVMNLPRFAWLVLREHR